MTRQTRHHVLETANDASQPHQYLGCQKGNPRCLLGQPRSSKYAFKCSGCHILYALKNISGQQFQSATEAAIKKTTAEKAKDDAVTAAKNAKDAAAEAEEAAKAAADAETGILNLMS